MVGATFCALAIACSCVGCKKNSSYWDALLDDYEKIVGQTLAIQKRMKAGDTSAFSDMQSLNQKYTELGQKLQGASGQLTEVQQKRLVSILQKYQKDLAGL